MIDMHLFELRTVKTCMTYPISEFPECRIHLILLFFRFISLLIDKILIFLEYY